MPKLLYRCISCWQYTMDADHCPVCSGKVVLAHPPKYSPHDKYGHYRRQLKREHLNETTEK